MRERFYIWLGAALIRLTLFVLRGERGEKFKAAWTELAAMRPDGHLYMQMLERVTSGAS